MGRRGATTRELQDLYHARFEHFVRVAASICGDGDSGRDAVQAAFVSAVRTRRSFRGDGPLEAWVWRMVVNEARRLARAHARVEPLDAASRRGAERRSVTTPSACAPSSPRCPRGSARSCSCATTPTSSTATIAEVLEIEPGTVAATLNAAHRALREQTGRRPVDDRRRDHVPRPSCTAWSPSTRRPTGTRSQAPHARGEARAGSGWPSGPSRRCSAAAALALATPLGGAIARRPRATSRRG